MPQIKMIVRRCLPWCFAIGVALTTLLGLLPGQSVPQLFQFWDKAQHLSAFAVLALVGGFAFPNRVAFVGFGLIAHGGLIEIMQSTLTTTRSGDPMDWLTDGIGVAAGIAAYAGLSSRRSPAAAADPASAKHPR